MAVRRRRRRRPAASEQGRSVRAPPCKQRGAAKSISVYGVSEFGRREDTFSLPLQAARAFAKNDKHQNSFPEYADVVGGANVKKNPKYISHASRNESIFYAFPFKHQNRPVN